jgi:hypothetical protein
LKDGHDGFSRNLRPVEVNAMDFITIIRLFMGNYINSGGNSNLSMY